MKFSLISCCFANIPVRLCGDVLELLMKKMERSYLEDLFLALISEEHEVKEHF